MNYSRTFYNLEELLKQKGYSQNLSNADIESAAEYIDMQDNDYTIFKWLADTEECCPAWLQIGERCWER